MFRVLSYTLVIACLVANRVAADEPIVPRIDPNGDPLPPGALARLGTLSLRHANKVSAVAFSPDGKLLASASGDEGSRDNTIRLWDVVSGAQRRCLTGHQYGVYCVAFSPDGKLVVSGSHDSAIRFWDVATGNEVRRLD